MCLVQLEQLNCAKMLTIVLSCSKSTPRPSRQSSRKRKASQDHPPPVTPPQGPGYANKVTETLLYLLSEWLLLGLVSGEDREMMEEAIATFATRIAQTGEVWKIYVRAWFVLVCIQYMHVCMYIRMCVCAYNYMYIILIMHACRITIHDSHSVEIGLRSYMHVYMKAKVYSRSPAWSPEVKCTQHSYSYIYVIFWL